MRFTIPSLVAMMGFSALARQNTLNTAPKSLDAGVRLNAIPSDSEYRSLVSKAHPNSQVRIKSHTGWCDPETKSYTGYIDSGDGKQLFFYFFESRSEPEEDDVVMWINGGPGGSSAMGLFMEQGPCRIKTDPKGINDTYVKPDAWNSKANVFFLDSPIGVGFSHAENGQTVYTTEEAAVDVASFIDIFFDTFKEYKGRALHMTGESYGGRYLPVFASRVYDQNSLLIKQGREPINLKSVMIGNGGTSLFKLVESSYEFMCQKNRDLGRSVLDIGSCVIMAEKVPKCHKNLQKYCIDTSDYTSCGMWLDYCENMWAGTAVIAGVNWYNVNQTCSLEEKMKFNCLAGSVDVQTYLNLPDVRHVLGVDKHVKHFEMSSSNVARGFAAGHDFSHQTYYYVANLLERGIKVLNYVGTLDAACDHIGQSKWMAEMPWTGRQGYLDAETVDWYVNGELAGNYKTFGDLTLLKVYGAGHLVPTDRPKQSLVLLNDWIASTK